MGKVGVVCPWGRGHMRQAPGLCLQMGVACRKGAWFAARGAWPRVSILRVGEQKAGGRVGGVALEKVGVVK